MNDRLILITGANGQTPSFLARYYLSKKAELILVWHNRQDRIADLADNPKVHLIRQDLVDFDGLASQLDQIRSKIGKSPDSLIHCASIRSSDSKAVHNSDSDAWRRVLEVNLLGFYNTLRAVLPNMQDNKFGRVVLLASNVTRSGLANGSAYAASKAAMVNLMRSTALENHESNIVLNAVSPGPIDTKLEDDYSGDYLEFRKKYFDDYLKQNPGKRLCTTAEIAKYCDLFLDSEIHNGTGLEILL